MERTRLPDILGQPHSEVISSAFAQMNKACSRRTGKRAIDEGMDHSGSHTGTAHTTPNLPVEATAQTTTDNREGHHMLKLRKSRDFVKSENDI